jgi:hypothetical protein
MDRTPKNCFDLLESAVEIRVDQAVADYHQIDIAPSPIRSLGDRAVDEGRLDAFSEGFKCLLQRAGETDRLDHQAVQLGEDRESGLAW